jgi:hypothetical protein
MRNRIAGMCCAVLMAFAAGTAVAQQPQAIAKEDVDYYKAVGAWVAELPAYLDKVSDAAQKAKYKERLAKLHEQYSALDDATKKYIRELDRIVANPDYSGNTVLPPSERSGLEKPRAQRARQPCHRSQERRGERWRCARRKDSERARDPEKLAGSADDDLREQRHEPGRRGSRSGRGRLRGEGVTQGERGSRQPAEEAREGLTLVRHAGR